MVKSQLKNRIKFTSTADKKLWAGIQKLSDKTKIPISKLIDMGIEEVLKKYEVKK